MTLSGYWSDGETVVPTSYFEDYSPSDIAREKEKSSREEALYSFEVATQGSYLALKASGMPARGGGIRETVKGFSRGSRRRLFQKLAKLKQDENALPLFVTLTYPAEYPEDHQTYKYHLKKFAERLLYSFPQSSFIWKLEYQERGAPHYHLIVFGLGKNEAMDYIPRAWAGVVDSGDDNHLAWHQGELGNRHCVEPVKSWHGVMAYASKYIGKVDTEHPDLPTGRIWGTRGKLPLSEVKEREKLTYQEAVMLKRIIERITRRKRKGEAAYQIGFWTFSQGKDFWGVAQTIFSQIELQAPENNPPALFVSGWYRHVPDDPELYEVDFFI
jgi:hypothetical protein